MILLVSGATVTTDRLAGHPHLGWLATPRSCSVGSRIRKGMLWAADNDCFQQLNKVAYVAMLKRIAQVDRTDLLFVSAPDVVGDSAATMLRWRMWQPVLAYYGLPAAFVAQDGQQLTDTPWHQMAALFIGGSTRFKEHEAAGLIVEAKQRGLWVHAGRVNTLRRAELMGALGVDSIDGTQFSMFPDRWIPWMLRTLPYKQHGWMEALCSSACIS